MESPLYANLVLLLEIAIGLAPLAGMGLARRKRFRGHAWCQSVAVLLNFVLVVMVMPPSLREKSIELSLVDLDSPDAYNLWMPFEEKS